MSRREPREPQPRRITSLAGAYLEQAVDAVRDSATAERLYREVDDLYAGSLLAPTQQHLDALNARIRHLRTGLLLAAFSAEAYINEVLAESLGPTDAGAADKLRVEDKWVMASRLAGQGDLVRRGEEPHSTLVALFRTRNRLVHPKPGKGPSGYADPRIEDDEQYYGPSVVVRQILAVADAAMLLQPLRTSRYSAMPYSDIHHHRSVLEQHLELTGRRLVDVPRIGDPPPPDIALEMARRRYRLGREARAQEAPPSGEA